MAYRSGVHRHLFSFKYSVNILFTVSKVLLLSILLHKTCGFCISQRVWPKFVRFTLQRYLFFEYYGIETLLNFYKMFKYSRQVSFFVIAIMSK